MEQPGRRPRHAVASDERALVLLVWVGQSERRQTWFAQVIASGDAPSPELEARTLVGAGLLAMAQGDFARAVGRLEPARVQAEAIGDRAAAGRALFGLGVIAQDEASPSLAQTRFEAALDEFEATDDQPWIATALNNLGLVVARQGGVDQGQALLMRALHIHEALGYAPGAALARRFLGQVAQQRGDDAAAARFYLDSLGPEWRRS